MRRRRTEPAGPVALALLFGCGLAAAPATAAELLELERFLPRPRVLQVALSPVGERVAYLRREDHGVSIWTLEAGGERLRRADSPLVEGLHWSLYGEGLCLEAGERLAYLPLGGGRPSFLLRLDPLREQELWGVDPVRPHHLLVTEKAGEGAYRLLRVGRGGDLEVVFESGAPIRSFLLDEAGRVAYLTATDGLELVVYGIEEAAGGESKRRPILRCDVYRTCDLEARLPDGRLLLRARPDGDRLKAVVLDAAGGGTEVLHQDPLGLADLRSLAVDPASGEALLAVYDTESRRNEPLSKPVADHLARISGQLPRARLEVEARGPGGRRWLVIETGARLQLPRFHLYDTGTGRLAEILADERRQALTLPEERLAEKRHLGYRASDGRLVHGFLSLPRGVEPRSAPLVAKVHGGPWSHVGSGYDAITQFLVSRGYAVFEPDFRGSTGYGLDYVLAARGEFGDGRVHRDIVEGVEWLLRQGIGDGERVAILGHSFGGFSALGAVAFSPRLFRAAVASAPAIDLVRALGDLEDDVLLPNGLPQREVLLHYLVDRRDEASQLARLRRSSPEAHLADTARPVLIFAGGRDEKIPLVDVRHYALALDGLGKDVSLLVDGDSGHSFEDEGLRRAYLYLVERFLARHLGGAAGSEDSAVEEYLEGRLELAGDSLRAALAGETRSPGDSNL